MWGLIIFLIAEAMAWGAPVIIIKRFRRPIEAHHIRVGESVIYVGLMCLFHIPLICTLGLMGNVLNRGPDQILPWLGLMAGAGVLAVLMLMSLRYRLVFDAVGLSFQPMVGRQRQLLWADIREVRYNERLMTVRFVAISGRGLTVPVGYENLQNLLHEASTKQLPFIGFDKIVWK